MIRHPSDGTVRMTTLRDLRDRHGPNWGLSVPETKRETVKAPTKEELEKHYSQYGLAFQPKQKTEAE